MSAPDFVFTMTLSGRAQYDALIGEVVTAAFRDLGCRPEAVAAIVAELRALPTPGIENPAGLEIRFVTAGGSCEVVLRAGPRELWRKSLHP